MEGAEADLELGAAGGELGVEVEEVGGDVDAGGEPPDSVPITSDTAALLARLLALGAK